MIYNLIRKDALLVRKYIYIMMVLAFVAPPILFINMKVDKEMAAFYAPIIFFIVLFVTVLFLSNSVSQVDERYNKGCAYLCTTPYGRKQIVISKYLFSYLIFVSYCVIYKLSGLLFGDYMVELDWKMISASFVVITIFRCILLPLEFKFGYEKTKYIITFLIIGMPFIVSLLFGEFSLSDIKLDRILEMDALTSVVAALIVVITNGVSIGLSCYIFERKDL